MSATNFGQEPSLPKRLGEIVQLPYAGDSFTATDGTVWKSINGIPLAYSATYSALLTDAPELVTSAVQMNGPLVSNTWQTLSSDCICGGTGGGATWLMMPQSSATFPYYFTSTNAGSTWTKRSVPVTGKVWRTLWDGTNFVMYANTTGATGVQESTDGITWTARTAISLTCVDLIFANSLYVAIGNSTTAATSTDRTTWTTRTTTATSTPLSNRTSMGNLTWNAGAGLWIMGTTTLGTIQTSPDAITWTNRLVFDDSPSLSTLSGVYFVSDSTTTVAVGLQGIYAYSTNGTSWTYGQLDANLSPQGNGPAFAYHDGTRFVVGYTTGSIIYYSTSGTGSWTRATRGALPGSGRPCRTPTGLITTQSSNIGMHLTDVTSTTSNNILHPTLIADVGVNLQSYIRIL